MNETPRAGFRNLSLTMTKAARNVAKTPGFESPYPVAVSQVGPKEWKLTAPLKFRTKAGRLFEVPIGQSTDFASIPSFLTWLVPSTTGIAAAVLHDALWRNRATLGNLGDKYVSFRDADAILYEALRSLGVSRVRAGTMWAAVRLGALAQPEGRLDWHADAPAVLGISLLMLPLLAVGLLLVPFAAVYKLVEWIFG